MEAQQLEMFLYNLMALGRKTIIWPAPEELLYEGSRLTLLRDLAKISGLPLNLTRIESPVEFCEAIQDSNVILKRTYSNIAYHPPMPHSSWKEEVQKFLKDKTAYTGVSQLSPCWYTMPYMPELCYKGKLCTICIGGEPIFTVLAIPISSAHHSELQVNFVYRITPLCTLAANKETITHERPATCLANETLVLSQLEQGDQEYFTYVLGSLKEIIQLEEQRLDNVNGSGLRQFCRIDVGVFLDSFCHYRYFVNNITRSHGLNLFAKYAPAASVNSFEKLADILGAIVRSRIYSM
jgi:hypothetical protein